MLRKILPHAAIALGNMYIVFYLIDRVNTAMGFVNHPLTKFILLIMSIVSIANGALLLYDVRCKLRRDAQRQAQQRRQSAPRPAPARRYEDGYARYDRRDHESRRDYSDRSGSSRYSNSESYRRTR